jgi:hypothetical protein
MVQPDSKPWLVGLLGVVQRQLPSFVRQNWAQSRKLKADKTLVAGFLGWSRCFIALRCLVRFREFSRIRTFVVIWRLIRF